MLLIFHIIIALTSIAYTGYVYVHPQKSRFYIAYIWVGATLITGTGLVIASPSHMVSACFTGIIYLAFITVGLVSAHKKFVKSESFK